MHKRMKGLAKAAAGVAAAALLMTGCTPGGDGGGGATGSPDSGELSFVYMGDADQQKAFNALFAEFNKEYPDIKLKAVGIPSGNWATFSTTVATRLAGGQKIDIIQVATEGQRLFASKGILEDLAPYIEQDQDVVDDYWADINPNLQKFNEEFASGPDGETVFIPGGFNTMAMYLNKPVFEKAGVAIPEDGNWTWDEFVAAGKQIKEKTGAYLTGAGSGYFVDVMPWLTTNGASTFNADWSEPTYNSDAAVESAEFARSLVEMGLAPKPGGQFDGNTAFKQGKLATLNGGRWPVLGIRDMEMVDQTVVVNWPTQTENGSPVGWDAWNITKNSENKQAAWTFIKFLMSQEAGEYFAQIGGTIVPARESVANSAAFTDNAPEGTVRLSEAMSFATPIPSIDQGAEAQKAIEEAWATIVAGQGEAQKTLDAAQAELESLVGE
ncbi:sugar ABC transporter substrate-binding protein [Agromyces sp. SYSU K20354]|uniref:ABC transporter substrate-binding protein n=1 Tax=Agromyces cavernae TaxID=2898659 RepID=UPI001E60DB29|nr:sugar ABC transporter substrate-binding protein [Agromyces cavernae]MCD2443610.1 sugar ABC transporter substrate-binding protein [Agromyces cavernae]